jgi:hypothetical protein
MICWKRLINARQGWLNLKISNMAYSAQCEPFIKKIGNSAKIRACLDKEQKEMEKLEKCVEKKVGPVGCTNDEHPKNLTIPIMTPEEQAAMQAQAAQQPQVRKILLIYLICLFSKLDKHRQKWDNI